MGGLSLGRLPLGMILFAALMTLDIYIFGHKMRKLMPGGKTNISMWQETSSLPGKAVLIEIGSLICIGWFSVDGW